MNTEKQNRQITIMKTKHETYIYKKYFKHTYRYNELDQHICILKSAFGHHTQEQNKIQVVKKTYQIILSILLKLHLFNQGREGYFENVLNCKKNEKNNIKICFNF